MTHTRSLRVVYMGTPDFAVPALDALIGSRHDVVAVVTNPDRKSGRGKKVQYSPVKERALADEIEVFQPLKFRKNQEAIDQVSAYEPDVIVVAAYGQILPQAVLDIAPMGSLNIHASLLPKYRGAAPINWCIVRGETESGVTIMQMEAGLDTGPMLLEEAVAIGPMDTAQILHDKLSPMGGRLLLKTLDGLLDGSITPRPQDDEQATWAPMISKEDGAIDWAVSASDVANLIRGFNPWPGTHSTYDGGLRIKFHLAEATDGDGAPGEVLVADSTQDLLTIACGTGAIRCLKVQAPGRRAMGVRDFLNGTDIVAGKTFGA